MTANEYTSIVSQLLDEGGRKLVYKRRFLQLAYARSRIAGCTSRRDAAQASAALLAGLDGDTIVRLATPFFWRNVADLQAAAFEHRDLEGAIDAFVASVIDGFLPSSAKGTDCVPGLPSRADGYVFPCLERILDLAPGAILRHSQDGAIVRRAGDIAPRRRVGADRRVAA